MKRRILSVILGMAMVVGTVASLAACAGGAGSNTTGPNNVVSPTAEGVVSRDGNVPEGVTFGTEENPVKISFAISETDNDGFHLRSIESEETDTSEGVDAAVFRRNSYIEQRLGVDIVVNFHQDQGIMASIVHTALSANDDSYDIICGRQYEDVKLCLEGLLCDFNSLEDEVGNPIDYIDMDAPYWSSYYIDAMRCGDARYWLTGDLCLRYTGGFYCFFVNSEIYNTYLYDKYGSIYEVVKSGKWTYETLSQMVADSFANTDGDDAVTRSDQLGIALPVWDNVNGMSIAAGVEYSKTNDDGSITLLVGKGNQTLVSFMESVYNLLNSGFVYNYGGDYATAMSDFASGGACFAGARLNQAELYLTDMADDYCIIPCPKLYENQEYRSSVHDGVQLYGINLFSSQPAAAAATLEMMAAGSYIDVRPAYYDEALKYLYSRDEGAAEMIDLMGEVVYSDFVYIWQFTSEFNDLGFFLRNNVTGKKVTTIIGRYEESWKTGLESLVEQIKELEA